MWIGRPAHSVGATRGSLSFCWAPALLTGVPVPPYLPLHLRESVPTGTVRPCLGFRGKPGFDHRFAGHKRVRLYLPQSPQGTNAGHAAPEGMVGMHPWASSELPITQS